MGSLDDIIEVVQSLTMAELMFGNDPAVPGSIFQNRTAHPCVTLCDVVDNSLDRICNQYCPETEADDVGWFNMKDPEVAKYINGVGRSILISQLISLDQNIGRIFDKLQELDMYEDSTIIFTTDNGGNIGTYSSNDKLRGLKGYGMYGGVQTPTVIKSAGIKRNSTFEGIFHITDWLATFSELAEYEVSNNADSINQLEALKNGKSIREEVMIHYDPFSYDDNGLSPYTTAPYGAIQVGKWNLVGGQPNTKPFPPLWYATVDNGLEDFVRDTIAMDEWDEADPRDEGQSWWLFNVDTDPYQTTNLLGPKFINEEYTQIYNDLRIKIEDYAKNSVADPIATRDGRGYPICVPRDSKDQSDCFWTPGWCDNNGYL